MNYVIESKFSIGDIVTPTLSPEDKYFVSGFGVMGADEAGNVINYTIECSAGSGSVLKFYEYELALLEVKTN